ncbi:MAG: hypothetical protein U5J78_06725 [Parasphingorhabdus sp.]|nr:hypothetical protein [Parasphingorhabdus sp.]
MRWGYTVKIFPVYDSAKKEWVPGMRTAMGLPEPLYLYRKNGKEEKGQDIRNDDEQNDHD